jgi:PIN domain nuclease of toxin-antitoxin system
MRLLLDTHIFYWSLYDRSRLPNGALETIMGAEAVFVSAVSIWETAIKVRLGKMKGDPARLADHIPESGFKELPVWSRHAKLVATLPMHHSDPFDRLLIAQAMSEPLHFLTADTELKKYSELVLCA